MVESIAIMEYLLARYGPSPLAPAAEDAAFPLYQQFLHLSEVGLAASVYFVSGARNIAPADQRGNWTGFPLDLKWQIGVCALISNFLMAFAQALIFED